MCTVVWRAYSLTRAQTRLSKSRRKVAEAKAQLKLMNKQKNDAMTTFHATSKHHAKMQQALVHRQSQSRSEFQNYQNWRYYDPTLNYF